MAEVTPNTNLKPFKPGQSGNPAGRPKGIKSLSTVVRRLLADEKFFAALTKGNDKLEKLIKSLPNKNGADALTGAMLMTALKGDARSADWLRKTGYGDRIDVTMEDNPVIPILNGLAAATIEVINGAKKQGTQKPSKPLKKADPTPSTKKTVKKAPAIERPRNTPQKPLVTPKIMDTTPRKPIKLKRLPPA